MRKSWKGLPSAADLDAVCAEREIAAGSKRELPRRCYVDLMTPAELAIREVIGKVESVGCDVRLTDAVVLLTQAKEKVADFVDDLPLEGTLAEVISEGWLRLVGFKWHELDRQGTKHWLLWLGDVATRCYEDLGIELSEFHPGEWHAFLRADYAGRYSRFLHIRQLAHRDELIALIEALTGQKWNTANHWYGSVLKPEQAARRRADHERMDRRMLAARPWSDIEKDDSRGRALPEHMQGAIDGGKAK